MATALSATKATATLRFLTDPDQKPVTYNPAPGTGEPRREGRYGSFPVEINDARAVARSLSLDREGFVLVRQRTAVTNFFDEDQIKRLYYPEMRDLVALAVGAREVVIFDHTIRVAEQAVERSLRQPVPTVHNDYTEDSGPHRLVELLGEEAAKPWLAGRFAEFNVWRPIKGPVLMWPLAIADASSIGPRDLVRCDLVYPDRVGEIYIGAFNPGQRWYTVPRMEAHEALIIKCYDSAKDGRARFSLHAAYEDPASPADAPPRESIEVRAFARF